MMDVRMYYVYDTFKNQFINNKHVIIYEAYPQNIQHHTFINKCSWSCSLISVMLECRALLCSASRTHNFYILLRPNVRRNTAPPRSYCAVIMLVRPVICGLLDVWPRNCFFEYRCLPRLISITWIDVNLIIISHSWGRL